ncbi:MBL fold metallo-hydrolase [Mycobacterium sp. IDR2000157661]|uniref:MBL fold metallo-hydrolase n=1 Tax=Mycobacterium sp. IDR2000157661 TaxID=2867005 RepID=UPI001EED5648|nr:MBL fold metallo-hydrolase [Mycobacterium sp. IDR2000157661]ULE35378.1 MBL fold metallo-hydrolase [Mycobacterium sp. IDR2000157661]
MIRGAVRIGFGTASLLAGGWVLRAAHGAPAALGATPAEIENVARRSPNYRDGAFHNLEPATTLSIDREEQREIIWDLIGSRGSSRPNGPIPVVEPEPTETGTTQLSACWFGHSSALIELDGYRVLADPVWSKRCSPSQTVGPERLHEIPTPLEALSAVDAVVISHDHYDHLDIDTIVGLAKTQRSPFIVPLGIGAHLRKWGIPESRIVELDWYEDHTIGDLTLVCTPARHFSGRLFTRNTTLWASWAIKGPRHRAFFGGDTGYTKSFAETGEEHGPFDLTLLPIGAYHPAWPDIHMNPEEAVRAHLDVAEADSGLLVPIHWGTFRLAPHPWAEPVERLLRAADPAGVHVAVPKPGQRVERQTPAPADPWWRF